MTPSASIGGKVFCFDSRGFAQLSVVVEIFCILVVQPPSSLSGTQSLMRPSKGAAKKIPLSSKLSLFLQ